MFNSFKVLLFVIVSLSFASSDSTDIFSEETQIQTQALYESYTQISANEENVNKRICGIYASKLSKNFDNKPGCPLCNLNQVICSLYVSSDLNYKLRIISTKTSIEPNTLLYYEIGKVKVIDENNVLLDDEGTAKYRYREIGYICPLSKGYIGIKFKVISDSGVSKQNISKESSIFYCYKEYKEKEIETKSRNDFKNDFPFYDFMLKNDKQLYDRITKSENDLVYMKNALISAQMTKSKVIKTVGVIQAIAGATCSIITLADGLKTYKTGDKDRNGREETKNNWNKYHTTLTIASGSMMLTGAICIAF